MCVWGKQVKKKEGGTADRKGEGRKKGRDRMKKREGSIRGGEEKEI